MGPTHDLQSCLGVDLLAPRTALDKSGTTYIPNLAVASISYQFVGDGAELFDRVDENGLVVVDSTGASSPSLPLGVARKRETSCISFTTDTTAAPDSSQGSFTKKFERQQGHGGSPREDPLVPTSGTK
jgi:hypothetical protein